MEVKSLTLESESVGNEIEIRATIVIIVNWKMRKNQQRESNDEEKKEKTEATEIDENKLIGNEVDYLILLGSN